MHMTPFPNAESPPPPARVRRLIRARPALLVAVAALVLASMPTPAHAAGSYRPCAGTFVDPNGGLGYKRIRALRVGCRVARSVTRQYTRSLASKGYARVIVVYDFTERGWRCVRYQRGRADGYYLQIVCKASSGRRVRFRGYS